MFSYISCILLVGQFILQRIYFIYGFMASHVGKGKESEKWKNGGRKERMLLGENTQFERDGVVAIPGMGRCL